MSDGKDQYPGGSATPEQIFCLAEKYRQAAQLLHRDMGQPRDPLSRAPFRMTAIHSIELYLNALLLRLGHAPSSIRAMQHDLSKRTKLVVENGLQLRKRTADHLAALTGKREHLISRYGPEMTATVSEINRLMATLDEVAKKVSKMMKMED